MRRATLMARAAVFATCLAAAGSCDRSPAAPTPPSTPGPATPVITDLRIEGPEQVAPGEAPRYRALEVYSDGSTKDVTASSVWSPRSADFPIYFTGSGVAGPAKRGETRVSAHSATEGSLRVLVLEPGTFKLSGSVVSEDGGGPLEGVRIEVVSGTGQGIETTTSGTGAYALYGVSGPVRIRASADGFRSRDRDVVVEGHTASEVFTLAPVEPSADISGAWTMTLEPAPSCSSGYPASARGRTYRVEFVQAGTRTTATISSPTLLYPVTNLPGTVIGSRVQLAIWGDTDYGDWVYPSVVDYFGPTFGFAGILNGAVAGGTIRATLDGQIVYWDAPTFAPTWNCRAKDHVVTLTR